MFSNHQLSSLSHVERLLVQGPSPETVASISRFKVNSALLLNKLPSQFKDRILEIRVDGQNVEDWDS